jgi:DNA-binding NtrC family response regulator
VRELCNVLERAAIMAGGDAIKPEHLLLEEEPLGRALAPQKSEVSLQSSEFSASPVAVQSGTPVAESDTSSGEYIRAGLSMQEMEERLIQKTLVKVNDNRTQAAKLLGISVRTLRNKLKQYQKASVSL